MDPVVGTVALATAAAAAALGTASALLDRGRFRPWLWASAAAVWVATLVLSIQIWTENYEVIYVADHVRPGMDGAMRLAALWAGSEGSMLFFCAVVVAVLAVCTPPSRWQQAAASGATAVLATTCALAADPFERLDLAPLEGLGPPPILEHPAMLIHPPMLYLGMALCLAPALTAFGDDGVARRTAAAATAVTTAALALGAVWAYVELGWGGWWAWDPVENVALVCWLLLLASLHSRRQTTRLRLYAALWPAVFGGAALTRTSLRTSVHAFADASAIGWGLWPLTALATVGALVVWRVAVGPSGHSRTWHGRQRTVAVVLLASSAVVVALGTYRPFLPGAATQGWFYSRLLFGPLVLALPLMSLRWADRKNVLLAAAGGIVGAAVALGAGARQPTQVALAAAAGSALATGLSPRQQVRSLAHLGFALVALGIVGTTAASTVAATLQLGTPQTVRGHEVELIALDVVEDPFLAVEASIEIDGSPHVTSIVQRVDRGVRISEAATDRGLLGDVQVILRSADDTGAAAVLINVQPLTSMVWIGAAMIAAAALCIAVRRDPCHRSTRPTAADSTDCARALSVESESRLRAQEDDLHTHL